MLLYRTEISDETKEIQYKTWTVPELKVLSSEIDPAKIRLIG
jgi:hypothetical protein